MVDRDVLRGKSDAIGRHVQRIRESGALDCERFLGDCVLQDATLFNLVQAVQAAVDLGAHVLADAGWETPRTLAHTFSVLARHKLISEPLATHLAALAGLRNLVVHRYGDLDVRRVHEDLVEDLAGLESFVVAIGSATEG